MLGKPGVLMVIAAAIAMLSLVSAIPASCTETKEKLHTPAAIETLGIPPSMLTDARAAQRQGKRIFLWRDSNKSVTASSTMFGQLIFVTINFVRLFTDDNKKFNFYFLTGASGKDNVTFEYGSETQGPDPIKRNGSDGVGFISPKHKLAGDGFAFVFAVEPAKGGQSEKPRALSEAISNEIKLRIKFEDQKKQSK